MPTEKLGARTKHCDGVVGLVYLGPKLLAAAG